MARPRKDGTAAADTNRRTLTELYVKRAKPQASPFSVWDATARGLVLRIHPTGSRSFKFVYSHRGRKRWYHIGDADKMGLSDARRIAARVHLAVAEGKDPVALRQAEKGAGTFGELAARYLEEHAKRKNKSWEQADALVRRHLLPRWGKLDARTVARSDVRAMMGKLADSPVMANAVLTAASAIFSWALKQEVVTVNPCIGVERNAMRSRERVLSDSEIEGFWESFDSAGLIRSSALKVILLTGQRPGEVSCMRREHIKDGWWEMPGEPETSTGWPGTKNGQPHRVWLTEPVRDIIAEVSGDTNVSAGFIFPAVQGGPVYGLAEAMQAVCKQLGAQRATPHDLRRTFSTRVTKLGHGREAMNRVTNHREGGIADVYDLHEYADQNRAVWERVAAHMLALAEGRSPATNVVSLRQAQNFE
jgi:integrase